MNGLVGGPLLGPRTHGPRLNPALAQNVQCIRPSASDQQKNKLRCMQCSAQTQLKRF